MSEMLKDIRLMGKILEGVGGSVKDGFADYPIVDILTVFMVSWNIIKVDLLAIEQLKLTFYDYLRVVRDCLLKIIWS